MPKAKEQTTKPPATTEDTGTKPDDTTTDDGDEGSDDSGGGTITRAEYDKVAREAAASKKRLKELEAEKKKATDDSLKDQNKWEELAKKNEQERDEERAARANEESTFKNTLKSSRVAELAVKAGLKKEARDDLDLLSLDDIEVDKTESGRYIVRGADKVVEKLKKTKPHWFETAKAPPFNAGGGKGTSTTTTDGDDDGVWTAQKVSAVEKKYGQGSEQFKKAWNEWRGQAKKQKAS